MSNLPETIRPLELVRQLARVEGDMEIAGMKRLAGRLADSGGTVHADLRFGRDAGNVRYVRGRIRTRLTLTCQRCLEDLCFPVDIAVSLGIIGAAGEAESLPGEYEPLLLDESETMRLGDLIEDELILALPIVARHGREECSAALPEAPHEAHEAGGAETHRPFADLAELMKTR